MARMPAAEWHSLGDNPTHQPLMEKYDGIVCHTAVGSLYSTLGYFMHGNGEGYIGTESHFIVGAFGEIWQITDTARTADANLYGNSRLLSIETADSGDGFPAWSGSNVPPWRPEQKVAIARIIAWAAAEHDFPIVRMPDSLPSRRGVGYHRLGIDPYRVDGGEKWSDSYAKACPGDQRIADMDEVIDLAQHGAKPPYPQFRETSPAVGQVVGKLDAAGFFPGPKRDATNYYGAATKAAIVRLQRDQGWSGSDADGLIGPATWKVLLNMPDPPQKPKDPSKPLAEAWQRAEGDVVRALGINATVGDEYTKAHPNQKAFVTLHTEEVEALHAAQIRWQKKHDLATP